MKNLNEKNRVTSLKNTYKFVNEIITKIDVEEDKTVTIIDINDTKSDSSLINQEFNISKNGTLHYIKIGTNKSDVKRNYINNLGENATVQFSFFEFGSGSHTIHTKLENDNSNFILNALIDLKESNKINFDIKTNHIQKSTSNIAFKNLLNDKSFAKIDMFSIVENSASFSKTFQNSKTILLSDDSSIAVTPHLEISIDELEASHGATCGDLDKDSIYYLQSRGISENDAKQIVLNAIRNEVFSTLKNDDLIEYIKGLL